MARTFRRRSAGNRKSPFGYPERIHTDQTWHRRFWNISLLKRDYHSYMRQEGRRISPDNWDGFLPIAHKKRLFYAYGVA